MSTTEPHQGLPVKGYKPQSDMAVTRVNQAKALEEQLLRFLDELAADPETQADGRWFSIGRTHIEQGFMAINRSVFKPGRVSLPGDDEAS